MSFTGQLTYGELVGFVLYVNVLFKPVDKISAIMELYPKWMAGFKRFIEVIDSEPEVKDTEDAVDVASLLILDEATSALDTETELIIQEALTELAENRTTLIIAHRLGTIRDADRIFVVAEDGMVEEDRHDELIEQGDIFANLHRV